MFIKTIFYNQNKNINKETVDLEISMQKYISSKYDFTPKIYDIIYYDDKCHIHMEDLKELCLADKYGDKAEHIYDNNIWIQIHNIIRTLYESEGIEYIDITPYNFIEKNNKVYIIDFGHSYYNQKNNKINWFLQDFLDGINEWNPDFK